MTIIWYRIIFSFIFSSSIVSSLSSNSIYIDLIYPHLNDSSLLNNFYRNILRDIVRHRPIDTVQSPINISKIKLNDYDEEYLKNSCYETASDLLSAHGYNRNQSYLSQNDVQSLLPAILYSIENPGCSRQSPPSKSNSFFDVWILGLIVVITIKLIHMIIFSIAGDHLSSLASANASKSISNQQVRRQNSTISIRYPPLKYRLWLGLGLNAFTCGLMLGTIVYHLIPHIYDVPDENFDYVYLLRATIVCFGVYLFFIVEKLLRFRFKIDEIPSNELSEEQHELRKLSDSSMIQIARMHGTLHASGDDNHPHRHSNPPARIPLHNEADDEDSDLQSNQVPLNNEKASSPHNHHQHHVKIELPHQTRNLILYHIINDFSNDLIYGCGLSTAFAHNRLIGSVLSFLIFSEGFRRHSQTISSVGRKRGLLFLLISIFFILLGYIIGGILMEINQRYDNNLFYSRTEYIYSVVYGALFYTALVTLIPELNDFGHQLQVILKQANQTSKQRRLIKTLILICQNLFLIIGVIIALVLAAVWRYYHRINIFEYVCNRDSSRLFCPNH